MDSQPDVVVVGGGVIGLAVAGTLASRERDVTVFDRTGCYRGASLAAGGMLAPFMEAEHHEREKIDLCRRSLRRYPAFLDRVLGPGRAPEDVLGKGSYMVARHPEHEVDLERLYELQTRWDLPVERLSGEEIRRRVPGLNENVRMGLHAPAERYVNNRRLGLLLYRWCRRRGVNLADHETVEALDYGPGDRVRRLRTPYRTVKPSEVIIAAGARSGDLDGLKPADRMPVRPVKGQAVSVQPTGRDGPGHVVRSPDVYLVPHRSERLLIGATMEEKGFRSGNTAGAVLDLLHDAYEIMPGLAERPLLETWWGFRPFARDDRPIIGPSEATSNLTFATGHGRHGILLAAITARWVGTWVAERRLPGGIDPFLPGRFSDAGSPTGSFAPGSNPEGGMRADA